MLIQLKITNLAVIEDSVISFDGNKHYTALVGETGAGKSLIVNALSLLKGERFLPSLIRDNQKDVYVSGTFELGETFISQHPQFDKYLNGSNRLLIERTITPELKNKIKINSKTAAVKELRDIGSALIDIHSQGANSEITDESRHLVYLDAYISKKDPSFKKDFEEKYASLASLRREREKLLADSRDFDEDYLRFQIDEIEKHDLKEHEIEDLNEEFNNLKNMAQLKEKYSSYKQVTSFANQDLKDTISSLVYHIRQFDNTPLEEEANRVKEDSLELYDALSEFDSKFEELDNNPERIDQINERLFELKGLQRKYGKTTAEILGKLEEYKEKLEFSSNFQAKLEDIDYKIEKAEKAAYEAAEKLSALRVKESMNLSSEINHEMKDLGLRENGFEIAFEENDLSSNGIDSVAFYVALNEGFAPVRLKDAASGGESSRLMLALKTVLNRLAPGELLVFDEIDQGISGKTASLVARKIASISESTQVFVISHLVQVVASAKEAIRVSKRVENGKTKSYAESIEGEDFVYELAKLISGDKVTEAAKDQARVLMEEYGR